MTDGGTDDILIRTEGRAGRITLNRPKALNSLTYPQVLRITEALEAWTVEPAVQLVILDGAGGRALCAGGDIRAMYDSAQEGSGFARRFWADEYRLNASIGRYPKPYVALMDGIVMGGGIGLAGHASHRIVTERSQLAMPETTIGLVPDVGGSWLLSRAPGEIGVYLGLLGHRMGAADALYAGFADYHVPSAKLPELVAGLVRPGPAPAEVIEALTIPPGTSELRQRRDQIDSLFGHDSVEAIRAALEEAGTEWAAQRLADLATRSPKALKLALKSIREARGVFSLAEALRIEYRLTSRLFEDGEFIEGVRALIVDKDRAPKWNPPRLEDVTPEMVTGYFAPLPPGEELDLGKHAA